MHKHLEIAKKIARLLDNQFEIFGFKFGIDPLVGFIPVLGDILPFTLNLYFAWIAYDLEMGTEKILQIIWYGILDILLGFIPFLGDIIDFTYKAYSKSLILIENHLQSLPSQNFINGEKLN